jgi:trk system potassium uptake protein TrkA
MKILIAGSGDTGTHLAKMLADENQEVTLMGSDNDYLEGLDSLCNIMVALGNPESVGDLRKAGAASTDLFVAVTPHQAVNITSCQIAAALGAAQCVARVESGDVLDKSISHIFSRAGVQTLVYPEQLVAREIISFMERNWMSKYLDLHPGQLNMVAVKLRDEAPVSGKALRDLWQGNQPFHVALIRRGRHLIIPRGDDLMLRGDTVYFIVKPENIAKLAQATGEADVKIRNVMIAGGGKITSMICRDAGDRYRFTVIEPDRRKAREIAERFPDVTVVNASSRQLSVLHEEELGKMDIFVALTESDESNIVGCMVAKEAGVKKTVAQVEDISYIAEAENLWIDKVVNKKLITSAAILRRILDKDIKVGNLFSLEDADVAEIEVRDGARIARAPVKDLSLPAELTLGGMIRHGRGDIIGGSTRLMPGDHVMVIFRPGALLKVHHLFR